MTNAGNLIADVPLKKKGRSAQFFSDRVEFNGQSVRYDDIDILRTKAQTTIHTYAAIPVGRSFDGAVNFKMKNGKSLKINLSSMTVLGIPFGGSARKNEKLYPALFDAVFSVVAQNMAQRYIEMIRAGNQVEVAGLIINGSAASPKPKGKKPVTVSITRENYRDAQINGGYGVMVYDKSGESIWCSSVWDNANVLVLPYILDTFFGTV
ncbi:MAG: hypothetical protein FWG83_03140 [Oscillospiraceae bacterium]|nr:hypothetical protein [Oscillospiraceae bacterium]